MSRMPASIHDDTITNKKTWRRPGGPAGSRQRGGRPGGRFKIIGRFAGPAFIFPPRPDLTRAGLKNRPVGRPRAAEAPPKIMGKGGSRPGPPRPRKKRLARRPPRGSQKARPRLGTPTNLIELGHRRLERLFTAEVILNNILYLPKERRRASRHAPPRAYALVRGRPGRRTPEAESDLLSPAHRRSLVRRGSQTSSNLFQFPYF